MMRHGGVRALLLATALFLLALAAFLPASAEAQEIRLNQRATVLLSPSGSTLSFTATSNNDYAFKSFGGEGVSAQLFLSGESEPVAGGDGFDFKARLVSGRRYELKVSGQSGSCGVEIMRDALGRSFNRPLALNDLSASYDKVIAREYDVHWYQFTPKKTGQYLIAGRSGIGLRGQLLDRDGNPITPTHQSDPDAYFFLQAPLTQGQTYSLRVSAEGDARGRYNLCFAFAEGGAAMPRALRLDQEALTLAGGERVRLTPALEPSGAASEVVFLSTDARVAQVTDSGVVTAAGSGDAEIVALGFGGVIRRCPVSVEPVTVQSIQFDQQSIRLPVGEQLPLAYTILPKQANRRRVQFASSDEAIVKVGKDGGILGVAIGTTTVRVSVSDGPSAEVRVEVTETPPARRALVMGEQRYLDGRIRMGSVNTTQGIADLLRAQNFSGYGYEVTMRMDSTSAEAVEAIRQTFKGATARDVSLFYINCHGKLVGGVPYLEFYDGSTLSAHALEAELRKVPGTVVVLIDCCNSGGFLSKTQSRQFSRRLTSAFGAGSFAMSKYRVLCSSSATENSYRISKKNAESEANTATVFARALCEAGGWDLLRDKAITAKADANKDGEISLHETYLYALGRVKHFLKNTADEQAVQVYPRGSQFAIFSN